MTTAAVRRALGGVTAAGPAAYTIGWVVASATSPSYQPWRDDLSALAIGGAPRPWLPIGAELLLAVGLVAAAVGLASTLSGRDIAVGACLLTLTGLAVAVQAFAREDCNTGLTACRAREQAGLVSWHHAMHGYVAVLAFLTGLAAPVILARPFRADPRWRAFSTYSILTTLAGAAALLAYAAVPDALTGLGERVFVSILVAWLITIGVHTSRSDDAATLYLPRIASRLVKRRARTHGGGRRDGHGGDA